MMTVSLRHHFSAGHRILGLEGPAAKCANAHGHTFGVCATFDQPAALAVEFTSAKATLRALLDEHFDHGYLVGAEDHVMLKFLRDNGLKHYVMSGWPTTEAIALEIAGQLMQRVKDAVLLSVEVTEGPQNSAKWSR